MKRLYSLALVALVALALGIVGSIGVDRAYAQVGGPSQVEYLLKIDGIAGESDVQGHQGEISVMAFDWSESNAVPSTGGGSGAGKVQMGDLHIVALTSKASPKIMEAVAQGKHFKEAVLTVRRTGGDSSVEYLKIRLEDVVITGYSLEGGDIPQDSFSLDFGRIVFTYSPQKPDGSLDAPVNGSWNIRTNTIA